VYAVPLASVVDAVYKTPPPPPPAPTQPPPPPPAAITRLSTVMLGLEKVGDLTNPFAIDAILKIVVAKVIYLSVN
jgi:hypothetical protein